VAVGAGVTVDDVRAIVADLPRAYEAFVRGRVKFRVGRIVFLSLSKDGETMGFGFPKAWRQAQVDAEPEKFSLPSEHDMQYHWLHVKLAKIDAGELRDLVEGAWSMCAPKGVVEEYRRSRERVE
jgi:hypothetical protein